MSTPTVGLPKIVTLGSTTLHTARTVATSRSQAMLEITERGLKGWFESVDSATDTEPHWSGDGDIELDERRAARVIEVSGLIRSLGPVGVAAGKAALTRLRRVEMKVEDPNTGITTLATVRKVSMQPYEDITPWLARFSIYLEAADPLRYSDATRALSNGSNSIPNIGSDDAAPLIWVDAPQNELTIQHPGGTFTLDALGSGSRLVDCRRGAVLAGGVRYFGEGSGAWPVVRSGGSTWTISGKGAGTLTLERFEAWA